LEDYVMKRMAFCIIPLMLVIMGCASSGKAMVETNGSSPGMELDAAIREAAAQMEAKIPLKTMVALVSVASPSTAFSTQVLTRLESAIVSSGKLVVVDRANLDKVREEQGFQLSGEVDDESAKSIGKLLGAGAIVTGSLADLGDVYSLTLKAINIETATVAVSYLADLAKSTRIETLLASVGGATGRSVPLAIAPTSVPAAPTPAPVQEYKIGDTGPAGGLVFYDKGYYADGWRYLEAGISDIGSGVPWSASQKKLSGTGTSVGAGKRNSELIRNSGESISAALAALNYNHGGYSDWFLPSTDELDFMYKNLNQKGGFSGGWYWSSSEYYGNVYNCAWKQSFSDGRRDYGGMGDKGQPYAVRAIRQF
jgi:hypothetical protein